MKVKLINGAATPKHGRKGDAGYDFFLTKDVKIKPRQQIAVDTGVCVELPQGYAGLFALRSSICNKNKHLILKNPLVDENYRGELHGILYNDSFFKTVKFKAGERVFSLYVFPVCQEDIVPSEELSSTNRGESWNGSSGK
jgi:dUTP pyrophosphatase